MDSSHEFLMFQHGNHSTNEKLEFYQNFIMTLLEELKTQREAMCTPCKQKWAASSAPTSRSSTTFHPQHAMLHYFFYSLYVILTFFTWFVDLSNWPGYARACCFSFLVSIFLYYSTKTQWNGAHLYPATPVSELPPSPMDFSYEFLMFQHGNHDTKEKMEYYPNFIMKLLGELKTLRETVCTTCQQKCASLKATRSGNQSLATPNDLMRPLKQRHVENDSPPLPEKDVFWRAPAPGSSSPPINETISSDSNSLSTERNNESDNRIFYAERDVLADSTIDVTFVHSFHHTTFVICVCFSRDEKYLAVGAASDNNTASVFIYGVESHIKYCELREYASQYGSYTRHVPYNLCFSPDGRYLVVVDGMERIIIWDVPKKRIRCILHGRSSNIRFSPDGRLVAFCTSVGVVLLNVRDNSIRKMVSVVGSCLDINPDGRLIATGYNDVLAILDARTGKDVKRWNNHGDQPHRRIKFTLDGRGLLCVYSNTIEQWDVSVAVPVLIRKSVIPTNLCGCHFTISPDHRLLAYFDVLLDVNSGKPRYKLQGHNNSLYPVMFSPTGRYLAMRGSDDGFVSLWRYTWYTWT